MRTTLCALALALSGAAYGADLCQPFDYSRAPRAALAETWCKANVTEAVTKMKAATTRDAIMRQANEISRCSDQQFAVLAAMGGAYPDCNAYLDRVRDRLP